MTPDPPVNTKGSRAAIVPLDSTKVHLVVDEALFNQDKSRDVLNRATDNQDQTFLDAQVDWSLLENDIEGDVFHRRSASKEFNYHSIVLNAATKSASLAVVRPVNAKDVSKTLKFAKKHKLSISVKSGGFNVAGWTVRGDITIDCSRLTKCSILLPGETTAIQGNAQVLSKRPRRPEAYDSVAQYPPVAMSDTNTRSSNSSRNSNNNQRESSRETSGTSGFQPSSSHSPSPIEDSSAHTSMSSRSGSDQQQQQRNKRLRPTTDHAIWQTSSWVAEQRRGSEIANSASSLFVPSPVAGPSSRPHNPYLQQSSPGNETNSMAFPVQSSSAATLFNPYDSGVSATFPFGSQPTGLPALESQLPVLDNSATPSGLPAASPQAMSRSGSSSSEGDAIPSTPAIVSVGSGVAVRQVDEFTAPYGYHVPLSAYPVGSASYHSGGFGFLSRKHGLTMDNIVGMEIVLAEGEIVNLINPKSDEFFDLPEAEQERQKELWFVCRGAAMTIGIVTRMDMQAFPVGKIYGVDLIYPFNPLTAPSLIKHWRDCLKDAPNDIFSSLILTAGPTASSSVVVINICYAGIRPNAKAPYTVDIAPADLFTQAVSSWQGEIALFKLCEIRTFLEQQDTNAKVLKVDADMRWSLRATVCAGLCDEQIHETCMRFARQIERSVWLFESAGGAIATASDPEFTCYPQKNRKGLFEVAAVHQWRGAEEDAKSKDEAWGWIRDVVCKGDDIGGPFPCFFECDEGLDRVSNTFGDNWDRLLKLKQKIDPDNIFCYTFLPTDAKLTGKRRAIDHVNGGVPVDGVANWPVELDEKKAQALD